MPTQIINDSSFTESWIIQNNSHLTVHGKTNINSFSCTVSEYGRLDTIEINEKRSPNGHYVVHSNLVVEVDDFDCHHKIMTKDLKKTLKTNEYPFMLIDILSLSQHISKALPQSSISTQLTITLAGVKKSFVMSFDVRQENDNRIMLRGDKGIQFSDFGLTPPRKLGGAIKVKNDLQVNIVLYLYPQ